MQQGFFVCCQYNLCVILIFMEWRVEYYKDVEGNEPAADFIDMLHGFIKKTDKTPVQDIELAEKRMNDFIIREGGQL